MSGISLRVVPLNADLLPDFLRFFDGVAFQDNPQWSSCYCQCFYEDHRTVEWSKRTAAVNREAARRRISAQQMRGYLAYRDDEVVGWCNAAPRRLLGALDAEPIEDSSEVGTILCFLVTPSHRGQGVATALLAGACDGFRAQGLRFAEANPRPGAQGAAANHFGPLAMYLASGFVQWRADADGSVWVRKPL
jgi:GNAT superfamily N-acetyltransferase